MTSRQLSLRAGLIALVGIMSLSTASPAKAAKYGGCDAFQCLFICPGSIQCDITCPARCFITDCLQDGTNYPSTWACAPIE